MRFEPQVLLVALVFAVALANACAAGAARFNPIQVPEDLLGGEPELAPLPGGECELAEVPWDLPGEGRALAVRPGEAGVRIPVGQKATHVRFLHALEAGPAIDEWRRQMRGAIQSAGPYPERPVVSRYVIHYADGTRLEALVRWQEQIEALVRRTFVPESRFVADMAWADVAWKGKLDQDRDERRVLYAMQWPNPYPDREIDCIATEGLEQEFGTVHLVAVTAEKRPAAGRVFYVAPDGDDSAPGTFEQPWATPGRAARTLEAGDTVYLRGGTYDVHEVVCPHNSGREGAWITYSGYPGEVAVLNGSDIHTDREKNEMVINNGEDVVTIASRTGVLHVFERSYIRVKGLHFRDCAYAGLGVDAPPWWPAEPAAEELNGSHHVELLHNYIHRTVFVGLGVYGSIIPDYVSLEHVRIVGNRVLNAYDKEFTLTTTDPGTQARIRQAHREGDRFGDENLDLHAVQHFEVAHNHIGWGGKEGIDIMNGSRHGRVHHNYVHDNYVYPTFLGGKIGIYLDTRSEEYELEVDHNVCERAGIGIAVRNEDFAPAHGIRIHHNLLLGNYWSGLGIYGKGDEGNVMRDIEFSNNTMYRNGYLESNKSPGGGLHLRNRKGGLHGITVRNNIAVGGRDYGLATNRECDRVSDEVRIDHNLIWPPELEVDPRRWRQWVPTFGDWPVLEEPGFIDPEGYNFRLREDSPAIDAGHPDERYSDPDGTRGDVGAFPRLRERQ